MSSSLIVVSGFHCIMYFTHVYIMYEVIDSTCIHACVLKHVRQATYVPVQAYFSNGDPCGGAPARSLTVNLVCGHEENMWGGEEPATCVYTVWMSTPLACTDDDLAKVSVCVCPDNGNACIPLAQPGQHLL